jgi:hypothetical protein
LGKEAKMNLIRKILKKISSFIAGVLPKFLRSEMIVELTINGWSKTKTT